MIVLVISTMGNLDLFRWKNVDSFFGSFQAISSSPLIICIRYPCALVSAKNSCLYRFSFHGSGSVWVSDGS